MVIVTDGGTASNRTTGYNATGACTSTTKPAGGCFTIPPTAKITVQTDEGCYFAVNVAGTDAGEGMLLAANEKLPSSVKTKNLTGKAWNWDGGSQSTPFTVVYNGSWVSFAPPVGGSACHAKVWERDGTE